MKSTDLQQHITDQIISQLEQGVAPWVKPWRDMKARGFDPRPHNFATGRYYNGINTLVLALTSSVAGYTSEGWATYNQVKAMGGNVRKGEHGSHVVLFKPTIFKDKETGEDQLIPIMRGFVVFNLNQCENLTEKLRDPATVSPALIGGNDAAQTTINATGATIEHGGNTACFIPSRDQINLPHPQQFADSGAYYSTAFHELGHWTGHKSRLDRDLGGRFGNDRYAAEELIAELTSAFLCAQHGINGKLQHAEYLANWLQVLKNDKRNIFTAAAAAQKAADYIMHFSAEQVAEEAGELDAA